jgi:hypothetical protein
MGAFALLLPLRSWGQSCTVNQSDTTHVVAQTYNNRGQTNGLEVIVNHTTYLLTGTNAPGTTNNPGDITTSDCSKLPAGGIGCLLVPNASGNACSIKQVIFDNATSGQAAAISLLTGPRYGSLTVQQALNRWIIGNNAGNGGTTAQNAAIAGEIQSLADGGIASNTTINTLSAANVATVYQAIQQGEGFQPGTTKMVQPTTITVVGGPPPPIETISSPLPMLLDDNDQAAAQCPGFDENDPTTEGGDPDDNADSSCQPCTGTCDECNGCEACGDCAACPPDQPDLGCGCGKPEPNECVCTGQSDLGCGCGNPAPDSCGCDPSVTDQGCGCGNPPDQGCGCGNPAPNECGCSGEADLGCGCGNGSPNECGSCTGDLSCLGGGGGGGGGGGCVDCELFPGWGSDCC